MKRATQDQLAIVMANMGKSRTTNYGDWEYTSCVVGYTEDVLKVTDPSVILNKITRLVGKGITVDTAYMDLEFFLECVEKGEFK